MTSVRDRATEAAIHLLGTEGLRSLTHARVDAAAGLPRGSTSNYFRTRAALLQGVGDRLATDDRIDWSARYDEQSPSLESFVEALAELVEVATGEGRIRTIARYTLFMESMLQPELHPVEQGRKAIESWALPVLGALGASDPRVAFQTLSAYLDGMYLHRLALPSTAADPRPEIRRVIESCLS